MTQGSRSVYAEARVTNEGHLSIIPYNSDDTWSLDLTHGMFVGHGAAVWLVQKRKEDFFFVQIHEEDVLEYGLHEKKFDVAKADAVRELYSSRAGTRFPTGPGIWCHRPKPGAVLWVAGHPPCRNRLDVALTLLNHKTHDIKRVRRINQVVSYDVDRKSGELGSCGAFHPRGKGVFSALFRDGKVDTRRQRVSRVPWLITYSLVEERWHLEILATSAADYDEIADALIDGCGLFEFDLIAPLLIQKQRARKRRRSAVAGTTLAAAPKQEEIQLG